MLRLDMSRRHCYNPNTKMGSPNVIFAATTALEKLEKIPPIFWAKLGGCVLAIILFVIIVTASPIVLDPDYGTDVEDGAPRRAQQPQGA